MTQTVPAVGAVLALALSVVACSDDDSDEAEQTTTTTTTEAETTTITADPVAEALEATGLPLCDDLPGMDTAEVRAADLSCITQTGDVEATGYTLWSCADGTVLIWSDLGWGRDPGTWNARVGPDGQVTSTRDDAVDDCIT
jgi:hypothetical protein